MKLVLKERSKTKKALGVLYQEKVNAQRKLRASQSQSRSGTLEPVGEIVDSENHDHEDAKLELENRNAKVEEIITYLRSREPDHEAEQLDVIRRFLENLHPVDRQYDIQVFVEENELNQDATVNNENLSQQEVESAQSFYKDEETSNGKLFEEG